MRLALKVDVSSRRGAKEGVPRLMEMLARHRARATFFLALGPDRMFQRPWLPGGDIGRRCAALFRGVRDAGFEVAIQAYDPVRWRQTIGAANAAWTQTQMECACEAFLRIFDAPAHAHGSSDWRMNRHAYRLTQRLQFRYASDTRGTCPYIPVRNAEIIACPQLPTTLPMLEELMARDGIAAEDAVTRLLEATARPVEPPCHVYTLRADREGILFAARFEDLLAGWRAQDYALTALEDCMRDINIARLPRHNVVDATIAGRRHPVALQGPEFLA